jgi:hypothetical protein
VTSLQQRLAKTGGRLIKHARYYWLQPAESHLTRQLFGGMLQRIVTLPGASRIGGPQGAADSDDEMGGGRSVCGIDWTKGISGGCVATRR